MNFVKCECVTHAAASLCVHECYITNPQMVFSQQCISCWHLDKCLASRAPLPFMLNNMAGLCTSLHAKQPSTYASLNASSICRLACVRWFAGFYLYLKPTMGHSLQMLHLAWCLAVSAAATLCRTGSQTIDWGSRRIQSTNCLGSSSTLLFTWTAKKEGSNDF